MVIMAHHFFQLLSNVQAHHVNIFICSCFTVKRWGCTLPGATASSLRWLLAGLVSNTNCKTMGNNNEHKIEPGQLRAKFNQKSHCSRDITQLNNNMYSNNPLTTLCMPMTNLTFRTHNISERNVVQYEMLCRHQIHSSNNGSIQSARHGAQTKRARRVCQPERSDDGH